MVICHLFTAGDPIRFGHNRVYGDDLPLSVQVTIALLKNAMIKSSSDMFLVDGFPRALDQAEIFERDVMPCQMVSSLPACKLRQLPCKPGCMCGNNVIALRVEVIA